jgi:hypothetical protein
MLQRPRFPFVYWRLGVRLEPVLHHSMKLSLALAICSLSAAVSTPVAIKSAIAADGEQELLQVDGAAFGSGTLSTTLDDRVLNPNFTWTDSSGNTRTKSEIMQALKSGKGLPKEVGIEDDGDAIAPRPRATMAHIDGRVGMVQHNSGKLYVLHIWIKRAAKWELLIYQAVTIGARTSAEPGNGTCENPCNTVPFQPRNEDEREVIRAYQAVERAVTAHDSAAWAAHIADEFFAVTSNSDRPLDKAARMAGLDNQKVAGIAPFPLVSARMFKFEDAVVMTSVQQPERGLPLHVTRVWFKRKGGWLEAYSYQTTIQPAISNR